MDEPTLAEMIRGLRTDVQRLVEREQLYVTQEQRATDKELFDLKLGAVAAAQEKDRLRLANMTRLLWSTIVGPVIVGVVLYVLLGGKS